MESNGSVEMNNEGIEMLTKHITTWQFFGLWLLLRSGFVNTGGYAVNAEWKVDLWLISNSVKRVKC